AHTRNRGAIRHEIPHRRLRPVQRDLPPVDTDAELQVRERRLRVGTHESRDYRNGGPTSTHGALPASARTRCSKSASGTGRRAVSPRTTRAGPAVAGKTGGGVTAHPFPSAAG